MKQAGSIWTLDLPKAEDAPQHIRGFIDEMTRKFNHVMEPDDSDYASVAMALARLGTKVGPDNADFDKVMKFVEQSQSRIKKATEVRLELTNAIESYIYWLKIWAVHRTTHDAVVSELNGLKKKDGAK